MVCIKCGRIIDDNLKTCPYCGVGIKVKNNFSDFNDSDSVKNNRNMDLEGFIDDLEDLKIKTNDNNKDLKSDQKATIISDEELENVLDDIMEYQKMRKEKKNKKESSKNISNPLLENTSEKSSPILENKNDIDESSKNYTMDEFDMYDLENEKEITPTNEESVKPKNQKIVHIPFEMETNKEKKTLSKILVIIISVLSFAFFVSIFFLYKNSFSSKSIFLKTINNISNEFNDVFKKINDHYSILNGMDIAEISSEANINETINNSFDNRKVKTRYIEDNIDKKQYFEYNNDDQKFVSLIKDNKLYINQETSSNTFYTLNSKYINILDLLNKDNINYLNKIFIDAIEENLNGNDFKNEKVKEKYNKVEYDLKKVSLELSGNKFNKIIIDILNSIKNDANAINIIEKNSKYTTKEIKEYFEKTISRMNEETNSDTVFKYSIYIDKNNNILMHSIKYQDKINMDCWIIGKTKNIKIKLNNDTYELKIVDKYDSFQINLTYNNSEQIDMQFIIQDDKYILNYQINKITYDKEAKRKIVNIISKPKIENNIYINNLTINVDSNLEDNNIRQTINMTNKIQSIKDFPSIDISNSNNVSALNKDIQNKYNKYFSYFIK